MTENLFNRELHYQSMMSICQAMRKAGAMSDEDFAKAEALLNAKYMPVFRIA